MSDLKMKINTNNEIKVKMRTNDSLSMKFDDYQKFKEEDPIFKDSPAYTITYNDINYWNNKSDFSGNYNDLTHKPNLLQYATIDYVESGLSNKVDKVTGMGLSQNSFTTEEKNKLASLENYDDSEIVSELNDKADISDIPTLTSDLENDSGFITKNVDDLTYYPTNDSVNSIVGLKQNIIDSENMLSADLVDDTSATNKFVTATDITTWNNKSDFSGDYDDLTHKPTIPTLTSQLTNDSGFLTSANIPTKTSDLQNDSGYITNAVNDLTNYTLSSNLATVATTGSYSDLTNKPTIPSVDSTVSTTSTNAVENQAITNYVNNLKPTLLWENNSLTSDFAGQQILLNDSLANYDYYEVLFLMSKYETIEVSTGMVNSAYSTTLMSLRCASGVGTISRFRDATRTTDTKIDFSGCSECRGGSTSVTITNDRIIPYKIIAYKY